MKIETCSALVINAPEFFQDPEFQSWLNNDEKKFTWHEGGTPGDWSDVVVMVDPGLGGEGSDSDMPEHIWDKIVAICRSKLAPARNAPHIIVRLTNLAE
ncbi:hypothetical protein [Burkholderia ubonensis]|uniref:hypothetical protein n=1 Tax=Burkholderia ubonensis TaxID=101571 RepID=UPI0007590E67|nr:hypothetical protein [Burkholderia ubonensis]KVP39979.1 hypothetical protein WJ87_07285 [Burkholderia ubonensis]